MPQFYALFCGLLCTLASCVQSRAVPCGDVLCPSGAVCTESGQCQFPEDIAACVAKVPRAVCEGRNGAGVCLDGACSVGQCGDGIVDAEEDCDDGNDNDVDSCTRNCRPTQWSASPVVGGPLQAIGAALIAPRGVAVGPLGDIYIADSGNHRVWRVDSYGTISAVAGTGTAGYAGDGGAGTSAQLADPSDVCVDGLGNIYISDSDNNRVRRIDRNGVIQTVAQLTYPWGVAVDGGGNLYIADRGKHRVLQVDSRGLVRTLVGTGMSGDSGDGGPGAMAQLSYPTEVAVDQDGNVYIADSGNRRIRRVNSNGTIQTVAGTGVSGDLKDGGPATSAHLTSPSGVAVDGLGNLYIVDNRRVRKVDHNGIITTVAGNGQYGFFGDGGPATSAELRNPWSVATDELGNVYIADTYNGRIRRVDASGVITTIAGGGADRGGALGDGGAGTMARLAAPSGVAVDRKGNVFIADSNHNVIRRMDSGGLVTTVAGTGESGFSGDGGAAINAQLGNPSGVAVDNNGNVYIADARNDAIRKVDDSGVIQTIAELRLDAPNGVAVDGFGNVYIADTAHHRVERVDVNGIVSTVAGTGTEGYSGDGGAAANALLTAPLAVAVDALGNLYIADSFNHRIRRVERNGVINTIAGTGARGYFGDGALATSAVLHTPTGVAVDELGNLYIADAGNHRIRQVDSNGVISTVAGTGTPGFTGDGGAGTNAELFYPSGVTTDGVGNLYIADSDNDRIRRLDRNGVIVTITGGQQLGGTTKNVRLVGVTAMVGDNVGATYLAAGASGIVARIQDSTITQVVGRYNHVVATGDLARFRGQSFGSVGGVAWDESGRRLYLTETSSNRVWVVTLVNPGNPDTWTIAPLVNDSGTAGFANGAALDARFLNPTGLWLDAASRTLYIADTGNHAIRALDLDSRTVTTVVNSKHSLGFAGDGGSAAAALLYQPQALTTCANGDLFIADSGNNRIRRVAASTGLISTVVGDGVPASSGQGAPATIFPVDNPLGVACDAANNLFVSSSTTVRLLPASATGIVDGSGDVQTIYGATPRNAFPASETSCLTGLMAPTATTLQVADSCSGLVVELTRTVVP